jgi:hypothetical protein
LGTGSGGIELWVGSAAYTLDASTGSGGIHVDQGATTESHSDKHHFAGKINGGGPTVRLETGSGGITVH